MINASPILKRLRLKSFLASLASLVLAATPVGAQHNKAATAPTLVTGSEVDLASAMKATWVQGEGPKSFEPGKVYIFECWATWCGPCIGMIPHVNDLHKKYHDKGLRVFGMSVWENDQQKVEAFVKKMGNRMTYPVAFTGQGSAFEKEWLTAAGAQSIPHAFIVRNGKLLGSTQASRLTDTLIQTILSGDAGAQKAADILSSANNNQENTDKMLQDIFVARRQNDADKMALILKELKAADPAHPSIQTQELLILMTRKDWPAAVTAINELPKSEAQKGFISMTGLQAAKPNNQGYSEDFLKALVNSYSDYVSNNKSPLGPNHFVCLSILQARIGDQENAIITAQKGIEASKFFHKDREFMTAAYTRFATSVKAGTVPTYAKLSEWIREARTAASPTPTKK